MAEQYPDMEIVVEQTANFSRQEAMMLWQISFRLRDQMLLMLCTATTMKWHLDAVKAIKDAGLTPGEDIQVVGIDGQKEAWELDKIW